MPTIKYRVTETAVYEIEVEIGDGLDPDSEQAREIAELRFCNLTYRGSVEVQARDVEPA